MKKKQMVLLIAFVLLTLIIPRSVAAKAPTEKVICTYQYEDKVLTYKVLNNEVTLPFIDGEANYYHGADFSTDYLLSSKINNTTYACPNITVEKNADFTTVFNNPRSEIECNGECTVLTAISTTSPKNIIVKKAVATTAIGSVGIYNANNYFIPYFRILDDGTKEWSINGKKYIPITSAAIVNTSATEKAVIRLDKTLISTIYKRNKVNDATIYRNVRKVGNTYEYLLSSSRVEGYNLQDGQATKASSYNAAYGDPTSGTDGWLDDYDQQQECTGKESLLGNYNDEDSVAWLIQKIFNYIKIIGPFIVVVMSGIDFAKVIVTGDDEGMKKAQNKLIIRLILAASLFVLPDLVSALLEIFGITSSGICGLQ